MIESEIRNAISTLNLPIDVKLLNQIINNIALNKQFTQNDLRIIKTYCPKKVAEFFEVLQTIKKQTPDLIIVSNEDAFSFD